MKLVRVRIVISLFVLALSVVSAQDMQTPQEICDAAEPQELTEMQFEAPEEVLEDGVDYSAVFCTDAGAVYVDLFEELTPITVNNFVFLAQEGYYDSTTFHRVIPDFMAQGGDPTATGAGNPGYSFEDEFVESLTFDEVGLLAMANSGPATNGSQFFITTAPTTHLNNVHTIFGEVIKGQENVIGLRPRDPQSAANPGDALNTIVIVTDPASVDVSYDVDDFVNTFEALTSNLAPAFSLDESVSGLYSTEETVASVPEDFQDGFAEFADTYGHEYRYVGRILNTDCDPQQLFTTLQFSVDAFPSAEDAEAAVGDDFPVELATANGFEPFEGLENTYSIEVETCAGDPGLYVMQLYTNGRYLITAEALLDQTLVDDTIADLTENEVVGDYAEGIDLFIKQGIASPFESRLDALQAGIEFTETRTGDSE